MRKQLMTKVHYKMYKKGKMWVFAGIVTTLLTLGMSGQVAQADETAPDSTPAASQASSAAGGQLQKAQVGLAPTAKAASSVADATPVPASSAKETTPAPENDSANKVEETPAPTENTTQQAAKPAAESLTNDATTKSTSNVSVGPSGTSTTTTDDPNVTAPKDTTKDQTKETINDWMPNKRLQQMVFEMLQGSSTTKTWKSVDDITKADMLRLTRLSTQDTQTSTYIDGKQSFSLEGLQYATNLTELDLLNDLDLNGSHWQGDITDVSPLKTLSKLQFLQFASNRVSDVTPIAGLKNITDLEISHNAIADFSSLNTKQYTKAFFINEQQITLPVVYLKDGQDTVQQTLNFKLPQNYGKTAAIDQTDAMGAEMFRWNRFANSVRVYDKGAIATDEGNGKVDYKVVEKQVMPQVVASTWEGWHWIANPYTYYLQANYYDSNGVAIASFYTPYIQAAAAKNVNVHYQDDQGNTIAEDTVLDDGAVGQTYTTTPKDIEHYQLMTTPANATGTFSDKTIDVTYIYKSLAAKLITVHYQDIAGVALQKDTVLDPGYIGDDYTTTPMKIEHYALTAMPTNATGKYGDQAIDITYVYKSLAAQLITVHYQDLAGVTVAQDTVLPAGEIGDSYTTTPVKVKGYALMTAPANASGVYGEKPIDITYIYKSLAAAAITVHYLDANGEAVAADTVLPAGEIDDSYTTAPVAVKGYAVKTTLANATGVYGEKPLDITYIYKSLAAAAITVHYLDANGEAVAADTVLPAGEIGDSYTTTPVAIKGYALKTTPANATGVYGEKSLDITYIYKSLAAAAVTVTYQDENGRDLVPSQTLPAGEIGQAYTTTPEDIAGYQLKTTPANATGVYGDKAVTIAYLYQAITKPVTPIDPEKPVDPETPTEPVTPVEPTDPTTPVTPEQPIDGGDGDTAVTQPAVKPAPTIKQDGAAATVTPVKPASHPAKVVKTGSAAAQVHPATGKSATGTKATTQVTTKAVQPVTVNVNGHATKVPVAKAATLPQTGDQTTTSIFGLALLGSLLGWFGLKRKQD